MKRNLVFFLQYIKNFRYSELGKQDEFDVQFGVFVRYRNFKIIGAVVVGNGYG